jgi:hypothetical protein
MRKTYVFVLTLLLALCLVAPASYAKGGGCNSPECQARLKQFESDQAQEKRTEHAKSAAAVAAGREQVKMFEFHDSNVFYTEKEINSWLRTNPTAKIVRIVPVGKTMVVFYYK